MPLGDAFRFTQQQRSIADRASGEPISKQLGLINNTPGNLQVSWSEPGRRGLVVRSIDGYGVVPLPDGVTEASLSGDTKARIALGDVYVETRALSEIPEVEMPRFSPPGGAMLNGSTFTIETEPGAFVTYLMSRDVPQPTDTRYGGPVGLAVGEHTISARAFKQGMRPSLTARVSYTVYVPPAEAPVVTAAGPSLWTTDQVSLSSTTPGNEIRYTTNGAVPGPSSTLYTGPFTLPAGSIAVRAVALATGYLQSPETIATFTVAVQPVAAAPQVTVPSGPIYTNDLIVLTAEAGALIYYTLDGSTPTTSSTLYTGPFSLPAGSYTLRFIAVGPGQLPSAVQTLTFVVTAQPSNTIPVISVALNTLLGTASVSVTGQDIYFTLDGSTPTTSSTRYVGPFPLGLGSTTISAFSSTPRYLASAVATTVASVTQLPQAETPTVSESSGTVTLSSATAGATIRYTLDGSGVTGTSTLYTAPFTLPPGTTIVTAVASKTNYRDSVPLVSPVVVTPPAQTATPTTNLDGGLTIDSTFVISLACATPGATIWYRTSSTGTYTTYTAPFTLPNAGAAVLQAYATAPGLLQSGLLTRDVTRRVRTPTFSYATPVYNSTLITITSESGAQIWWQLDGGTWAAYTSAVRVPAGTHTITAKAAKTGYIESALATVSLSVVVDPSPPTAPVLSPIDGTAVPFMHPYNIGVTVESDAVAQVLPPEHWGWGSSGWMSVGSGGVGFISLAMGIDVAQPTLRWQQTGSPCLAWRGGATHATYPIQLPRDRAIQIHMRSGATLAWRRTGAAANGVAAGAPGDCTVRHNGSALVNDAGSTMTVSTNNSPNVMFELEFLLATGELAATAGGSRLILGTGLDLAAEFQLVVSFGGSTPAWVAPAPWGVTLRTAADSLVLNRTLNSLVAPLGGAFGFRSLRNGVASNEVFARFPSAVQVATLDVPGWVSNAPMIQPGGQQYNGIGPAFTGGGIQFFSLGGTNRLGRGLYTVTLDPGHVGGTWVDYATQRSTAAGLVVCGSQQYAIETDGRFIPSGGYSDNTGYRATSSSFESESDLRMYNSRPIVIDAISGYAPGAAVSIGVLAKYGVVGNNRRFILARLSPQYD